MRLNKKLFCFLFVMFITIICCCAVSAADDSDMETTATATATTSNDVVKDVESTSNVHSDEVTGSMDDTLQSDNNNEEAVNQNGVLDENNNLNKVEKTKVSNRAVKTAKIYTGPEFWDLAQDGVINLTEDVTITSTVVLHSNLTVNGNGYTITSQGNHDLFEAHGTSESVYHSLTLYDLKVTGVPQNGTSKGFYVVDHGYEHVFIECEFIDNAGIYVEPAKTHDKTALTMINCYVSGCKGYAFDVPTEGTQRRRFNVYNCVFENNKNPIFNLFQNSEFYGYNFLINDTLVSNNDTFVGHHNDPSKPISVQQAIHINIIAYQCESNITIDCEPKVYIDEPNNITIRLLVTLYLEHLKENITLGAPSENVTLEVKYEDGSIQELYGTIGTDGTVKNLTDHTGRTFNWVAGEKTGIVNVTAVFDGSRFLVDGKHLYNSSSAKTTFEIVQIPTTTVVNDVTGKVGLLTNVNATVTNDSEIVGNDDPVPQGTVSFYYNDTIFLGNATVNNGFAEITGIVFNHTVDAELIKAKYHDENGKYSDSSDTANIKIQPGEAVMEATPNPKRGVPGVNSTVTISVTDKNTNTLLPNGTVNVADSQTGEIIISDVEIINGEGSFLYNITKDTLLSGTTLNLTFSSADYEDAKTQVTITRELIPTTTVVNPVNDTVYSPVTITANVTNNSGNLPVNQGNVTFTYNDNVIGTAQVSNGQASISYVFEEIVEDGVIYAQYVDNNDGEAKIFGDSEGSNKNTGKTNIGKREAKITATPEPASGIPGVTSTVTIIVTDVKDSNIKINGTVTIDDLNDTSKTFDPIEITEGEGTFDYSIIDTTLLTGNTINFKFKDYKGNYDDVDTTTIIKRELIPTVTVVSPVNGKVGVSTPVTATVTSSNDRVVDAGEVTFTYNGT
uniref:Ig-like domain-containing protein n=1 Tax=Methanosphaera sp. TaxID=2666342 RepID=UPI0025D63FD9